MRNMKQSAFPDMKSYKAVKSPNIVIPDNSIPSKKSVIVFISGSESNSPTSFDRLNRIEIEDWKSLNNYLIRLASSQMKFRIP